MISFRPAASVAAAALHPSPPSAAAAASAAATTATTAASATATLAAAGLLVKGAVVEDFVAGLGDLAVHELRVRTVLRPGQQHLSNSQPKRAREPESLESSKDRSAEADEGGGAYVGHELVVGAALQDFGVTEHADLVGVLDGGEAVGDQHDRRILQANELVKRLHTTQPPSPQLRSKPARHVACKWWC